MLFNNHFLEAWHHWLELGVGIGHNHRHLVGVVTCRHELWLHHGCMHLLRKCVLLLRMDDLKVSTFRISLHELWLLHTCELRCANHWLVWQLMLSFFQNYIVLVWNTWSNISNITHYLFTVTCKLDCLV